MENIKINCHSSICINEDIYIDPYNIEGHINNASLIFITHSHFDHLDINSIKNILKEDTIIVTIEECAKIIKENGINNNILVVKPNDAGFINSIGYETFPSYNIGHHHFKELGFVGYTLIIDGVRYTICGDSDNTSELQSIKTDILFVPIGGTYTMNDKEAAMLTNKIKPSLVIPVHYNCIEGTGTKEDEKEFIKELDKNIEYKIFIK